MLNGVTSIFQFSKTLGFSHVPLSEIRLHLLGAVARSQSQHGCVQLLNKIKRT